MSVTRFARRTASTSQAAFLLVLPNGGQNLARRNAWGSMSVDATRARARREAALAFAEAARTAAHHPVAASG
jgi:hypothetical protein